MTFQKEADFEEALIKCSCAVKKHKNKTGTDSRPALFRKARA